jgi:D-serine deaminase-like pyridoxal phosphate-dependent protein
MRIAELDTPALLIDLDVMERNLTRVAEYAREHKLRLRPHIKTHKIPALARRQLELGAAGLTAAKTTEAEVMLAAEPPDMLLAYPVIGARKTERLANLARRTKVTVALDSEEAAQEVSRAAVAGDVEIGVLAETDVGLGRVGIPPEEVVRLAECIGRLPGLRYEGLTFYPGHVKSMDENGLAALRTVDETVSACVKDLERAGLAPRIVSGGSTPALFHSHLVSAMNEIRPGTYIFNDRNTFACGACDWEDCAVSILATVVSTSVRNQMIIDGGSKTFSQDRLPTGGEGFGRVMEEPEAVFTRMNEEHGFVDLSRASRTFKVGEQARVIPNHVCVAVNLHEQVYGVRGDRVEEIWRVEARGKLQ